MDTWFWIVLVIAIVVVAGLVAAAAARRQRSKGLQEDFGPEYARTVDSTGDRGDAEKELSGRRKRREELDIIPLSDDARSRYASEWQDVQERFVDEPDGSVRDADRLVQRVMAERGYPMENFEQASADVSVDHPDVVENYRKGHQLLASHDDGQASTEDLRQAMVHYRALFDELLAEERRQEHQEQERTR